MKLELNDYAAFVLIALIVATALIAVLYLTGGKL